MAALLFTIGDVRFKYWVPILAGDTDVEVCQRLEERLLWFAIRRLLQVL